jgi:hypothetical protein
MQLLTTSITIDQPRLGFTSPPTACDWACSRRVFQYNVQSMYLNPNKSPTNTRCSCTEKQIMQMRPSYLNPPYPVGCGIIPFMPPNCPGAGLPVCIGPCVSINLEPPRIGPVSSSVLFAASLALRSSLSFFSTSRVAACCAI